MGQIYSNRKRLVMKILIDLTSLDDNFSGIERYALNMARALIAQAPEREYLLVFKNKVHEAFLDLCQTGCAEALVIPGHNKVWFQLLTLPMKLYRCRADVYLFLAHPDPLLFFRKNCMTVIYDLGCWDCVESIKPLNRVYGRMAYKKSMRYCKEILTISNFSKSRICAIGHVSEERVHILYSAPEDKFSPVLDVNAIQRAREKYHLPERYMLTLSTLAPNKNLALLLTAYKKLFESGAPILDLVLVGRPAWTKENYLSGFPEPIRGRIHFTGFVDDENLPAIYRGAKFFVFPSKYEGFGLPPLEAMACGVPVLSSDAASMPEILGDAAVYFRSEDVDDLQRKLLRITALNETEQQELMEKGLKQAAQYTWEKSGLVLSTIIQGFKSK